MTAPGTMHTGGIGGGMAAAVKQMLDAGGYHEMDKALLADGPGGINTDGWVPENLEMKAHSWLWKVSNLPALARIPTVKAKSRDHQYEVIDSYGSVRGPSFMREKGRAAQNVMRARRQSNRIVTIGEINNVSGMAIDQETIDMLGSRNAMVANRNATTLIHLLKKSFNIWFVDSEGSTSTLRWKGYLQLWREWLSDPVAYPNQPWNMSPDRFVDMRGAAPTRSKLRGIGTDMFTDGWGQFTHFFSDPKSIESFQGELEDVLKAERTPMVQQVDGGIIVGNPILGIKHQGGVARFFPDNALTPEFYFGETIYAGSQTVPEGASAKPPVAPAVAVAANALSRFEAADVSDPSRIQYKLQPTNECGDGAASAATGVVATTVGDSNTLTWSSAGDAEGYRVLRNTVDEPAKFYQIGEVKNDGPSLEFVDHNWFIPGGRWGFAVEMLSPKSPQTINPVNADSNAIRIAELRPFGTKPLASAGDYTEEMVYERCCPELPMPRRVYVLYNMGKR